MKRVTKKDSAGHYYMTGDGVFLVRSVRDRFMGEDVDAVGALEDILGDDYDLDRLRELVEADRDGRCVVLPDVDERARQSMADELQDVFSEWAYEDPDVGLFGMSDGEKELANALIAALKGDRDG